MANREPNRSIDPTTFPTPQALLHWLKPRLPSETVTLWGTKPGTKNVHNLWLELTLGESSILSNPNSPPICTTEMIFVEIIGNFNNNKKTLYQFSQLLSDGTMQPYNCPLSRRMKQGESPEDAAYLAIKEEFGSILQVEDVTQIVQMVPGKYKRVENEMKSLTYPGLKSRYVMHTLFTYVEGLTAGEPFFVTEVSEFGDCSEFKEFVDKALRVKRRNWIWGKNG
ncbi:hypothetical protein COLO4_35601 [Corchorus olitorius]|uniref:Nudix hydrolase domain-containing protein n=1 Tax=Corchorus olitorius TaxID=93759 RepID=A0A1R3GEU9_9ROSI|nr:hypothetical protein COLO4_35601 [Corchorus olitorius]